MLLGTLAPDGAEESAAGNRRARDGAAAERRARDQAAASFDRALGIARAHGARLWELRAATQLARLKPATSDGAAQAIELLSPIVEAFDEGDDAADLLSATTLLHELRERSDRREPAARRRTPPRRR